MQTIINAHGKESSVRIIKTAHPTIIREKTYTFYGTRYNDNGDPRVSAWGTDYFDVLAKLF